MAIARFTAEQRRIFQDAIQKAHKERQRALLSEPSNHGLYDAAYYEFLEYLDTVDDDPPHLP